MDRRNDWDMLKLYRFPGATCAAKVLMALHEKNAPFEDVVLARDDLSKAWYRALNPDGLVPTVVVGDATIVESSVILNYVEDAYPGTSLRPGEALECARMNLWLKRLDDVLAHLGTMTYAIALRPGFLAQTSGERDAYYASIKDLWVRTSRREAIELGLKAPAVGTAIDALAALQDLAENALADREYLCGAFSLADISLAPMAWRLEALGLLGSVGTHPQLNAWWTRVQSRASFGDGVAASAPPELMAGLRAAAAGVALDLARVTAGR